MKRFRLLALCFLPMASALAQESPRSGFAGIEGVVVDSLRGGFLRGATVGVNGTPRIAFTDSLGRFRIDSVPAGVHQVELFHEILDTLALRVYTAPTAVPQDSVITVSLGIPSARTIVRAKCGGENADAGAMLGMVMDPEADQPVQDAQVKLEWTELVASRESGLSYRQRSRVATSDASGRYIFCGLLAGMSADLSVTHGEQRIGPIPVGLGVSPLGTASVFLPASAAEGSAVVQGTISDSSGAPVSGARVGLASTGGSALTDSAGRFSLSSVTSGTQTLVVRRLGYQPMESVVHLRTSAPQEVNVQLRALVPVLEAVYVEARRNFALENVGFSRRKRAGLGRYLLREDLDRRSAFNVSDYLRQMPELHRPSGTGQGTCVRYYVDGMEWRDAQPDEFVTPTEVGAMEVYSSAFVPSEFQGFEPCAVVVIWTKWKLGLR